MSTGTMWLLLFGGAATVLLVTAASENKARPASRGIDTGFNPNANPSNYTPEVNANPALANTMQRPLYSGYCDPQTQSCEGFTSPIPQVSGCDPQFQTCIG